MYDSVTQNFDRVSDLNDSGLIPLQGQQDEQPEGVYIPGNAIDDVIDIMTYSRQESISFVSRAQRQVC